MAGFEILNQSFYDKKGNKISKEDFKKQWNLFEQDKDIQYYSALDEIIKQIPDIYNEEQKMEFLFNYFVSNIRYDYSVLDNPGKDGLVNENYYNFNNWENWKISSAEKYCPILLKIGICAGIASAFEEVCNRIGIDCRTISGDTKIIDEETGTRLCHCWNIVNTLEGEKHVDVTYGIFNKDKNQNQLDFFNITTEQLEKTGPHCNFYDSLSKNPKSL